MSRGRGIPLPGIFGILGFTGMLVGHFVNSPEIFWISAAVFVLSLASMFFYTARRW